MSAPQFFFCNKLSWEFDFMFSVHNVRLHTHTHTKKKRQHFVFRKIALGLYLRDPSHLISVQLTPLRFYLAQPPQPARPTSLRARSSCSIHRAAALPRNPTRSAATEDPLALWNRWSASPFAFTLCRVKECVLIQHDAVIIDSCYRVDFGAISDDLRLCKERRWGPG